MSDRERERSGKSTAKKAEPAAYEEPAEPKQAPAPKLDPIWNHETATWQPPSDPPAPPPVQTPNPISDPSQSIPPEP